MKTKKITQNNIDEFRATFDNDDINIIKIKFPEENINTPNFYASCYCIKPATTHNVLTIKASTMHNYLEIYGLNFHICLEHELSSEGVTVNKKKCIHCTEFLNFNSTFAIQTRFKFYIFPPPIINNNRSINFFRTFIEEAWDNINKQSLICISDGEKREEVYYNNFMNHDFKQGTLKNNISGKTSFVRNKILAYKTKGVRGVLTIDCELTPHYISIPQKEFDILDLATPLVIVNRAPSINDTCIYVAEILRNEDPCDFTIHINPYITHGLHADQDGDEVTLFYLEKQDDEPSSAMQSAIAELRNSSWKYGRRHNFAYKCKYSFTQYHRYLLFILNDFFCQHNALWKKINEYGFVNKPDTLMNLGCSILHQEVDEFLDLVSAVTGNLKCLLTPISDILHGNGDLSAVVESGAKGTPTHIETFLNHLYKSNGPDYEKLIKSFNKYISSSGDIKQGGYRQFIFLYCINPINMHNDCVYANNEIILKGLRDADSMSGYYHNVHAVEYFARNLLSNRDLEVSDQEIDLELKNY